MKKVRNHFKRMLLSSFKALIFSLLYIRLVILIARHRVTRISRRKIDSKMIYRFSKLYLFKNVPELNRAAFAWSLADKTIRTRVLIVSTAFMLGFLLLSLRLFQVTSSSSGDKNAVSSGSSGMRYDITDRNGTLLAVNVPSASLYANPYKVIEPELSVQKLHHVFPEIDKEKVLKSLKSGRRFVWIKRDLSPRQQQEIYNLGMPGFEFEKEQKRIYTYGNMVSHIIGYVGRDGTGLAGLEKKFDKFLKGENTLEDKIEGDKLVLSIDIRMQSILSDEMNKTIEKFSAKGGAGIIANPQTGEILAMVSKPDFDPHFPGRGKQSNLFNFATQGTYEMGSGMKALTMAVGFDTDTITMRDAYDLTYMKVGKWQIKDTHPKKGWVSVPEIFLKSSNVGVSQIVLEIGKHKLRDYLKKLKLLDKLELEVPELGRPLYPSFKKWSDIGLVTMSYGYGISESPAHFIQCMIPVVNGGISYPITLLKHSDEDLVAERVFKEETSMKMRQLMRLVVKEGTGRKAQVPGYYVGGKTGTAYKAINGKYDKTKRYSSFFAAMPVTDPDLILYLIYDDPKGIKETFGFSGGGWTAAPSAGNVLKRIAALYSYPKPDEHSEEVRELEDVVYKISNET